MASLTASGLGSGLDVSSIVSQLMAIERQPIKTLQSAETSINAKISSFGKIQSGLSSLRDKAAAFNSTSLWGQTSTTVSDASVATVTSVSGKNGAAGSHSLQVNALATTQTLSSAVFASSSATLSAGSLTIELGSWTGGTPPTGFSAKSGATPVTIDIADGETSLSAIRDKINKANAGVTAGIVTDSSGSRLTLRSTKTGEENAFRITATETSNDGNAATGLSALAYDATTASPMSRNQVAGNAQVLINGLSISSASNTIDNAIEGLSIKLTKTSSSPVELTVATDHADLKTKINDFISAFNSLSDTIKSETKYDPATKNAGKLQADRTAVDVQSQMRQMVFEAFSGSGSGDLKRLSDIGISINASGKLELKSSKLDAALENPTQVKELLNGGDSSTTALTGVMKRFRKYADSVLGTDGALQTRTDGLRSELKRNQTKQEALELRMTGIEARLNKQYQSLDTQMSKIGSLSSAVSNLSLLNRAYYY